MKDKLIFKDSLAFWLSRSGMTQAQLANKLGVNSNTISQYKTGVRTPPIENLTDIAEALGVTVPEFFACKDDSLPDIEFVSLVKAVPRAGDGGLLVDDDQDALYSFHASFLQRKKGSRETMRLFNVEGDSMEPVLRSGDMIMINLNEKDIRPGLIYLLRLEGSLMIKRLELRPGGIILIVSDNPKYEAIEVARDDASIDFEIFGRMVWSCREY